MTNNYSRIRIVHSKDANPTLLDMFRKAYHRASGNKGFCDPDLVFKS